VLEPISPADANGDWRTLHDLVRERMLDAHSALRKESGQAFDETDDG
jgi:hypothetical protein